VPGVSLMNAPRSFCILGSQDSKARCACFARCFSCHTSHMLYKAMFI